MLVNLGTPDSPGVADVRRYLREFLLDERVIDVAAWKRNLIVRLFILPFRPKASGEAYSQIWTDEGSPLLVYGRQLADKVRDRLGSAVRVELAMRYGSPSIPEALESFRRSGIQRIVVFPLYPQYSSATTGSTIQRLFEETGRRFNTPYLQVVPPFYDHPRFVDAWVEVARPVIERVRPERAFFSFHGLPERQIRKGDDSAGHCLVREDCCERITTVNRDCYRAQCYATARLVADRLGLTETQRVVCFQSRLGRDPWVRPYTDELLAREASSGVRRAVILSPAFVADCLETLEELGIRGVETWKENGGESLELIPAPNASDTWADAVVEIARESSRWLDPPSDR
jgi:ferrochelatase